MQHGACCGIRRVRQDTVPSSFVGVGVWRDQVHRVDQAQRVFYYLCILTDCLIDRLLLGGRWRGFSLSSSVFSSITHRRVILCLHSSSLLFYLSFYCYIIMIMNQSSLFVSSIVDYLTWIEERTLTILSKLVLSFSWIFFFFLFSFFQLIYSNYQFIKF